MAATCKLTAGGRSAQLGRYAELSRSVVRLERAPRAIDVLLAPGHDRELLAATLAVERECCPFLSIEERAGGFGVSVSGDGEAVVLDALAEALGA